MNFKSYIYVNFSKMGRNKDYLSKMINPQNKEFSSMLLADIIECQKNKDKWLLEQQISLFYIFSSYIEFDVFIDVLNQLIIEEWHEQHENIVYFLEFYICDNKSVPFLHKAILSNYKYLEWDESKAFERKCIWTLGKIHSEEARKELFYLCENDNNTIASYAKKQLKTSYQ